MGRRPTSGRRPTTQTSPSDAPHHRRRHRPSSSRCSCSSPRRDRAEPADRRASEVRRVSVLDAVARSARGDEEATLTFAATYRIVVVPTHDSETTVTSVGTTARALATTVSGSWVGLARALSFESRRA